MRASKILKEMGVTSVTTASNRVRELIHFYVTMGNNDDEIKVLIQDKVDDILKAQKALYATQIHAAMQFIWQRYRTRWPVARKMHKAQSGTGMTNYYYAAPDGIKAPPGWGFIVEGDHFELTLLGKLGEVTIKHADLLAEFDKKEVIEPAAPTPAPEDAPVIEVVSPAEDVFLPEKREGKETQIKTRPDQLSFAQSVKHNCFDICVVTGSRIHARCSAAHLVEHKDGGADYYTNGLWMRWDIHKMFDDGWCAIDPATLQIWFLPTAIELDADLVAYHGKTLSALRRPINMDFLKSRWDTFCALREKLEK
ncbi:hypothetical protein GNM83_20320 [Salmonella enterica]|nr:hypothetical protein [Salmonella enterica]